MSQKEEAKKRREVLRRGKKLLSEGQALRKKKRKKVGEDLSLELGTLLEGLKSELPSFGKRRDVDYKSLEMNNMRLDKFLTTHYGRWRKGPFRESFEGIAWALFFALLIRFFLFEAFSIPTSSMYPTLQIGDHLFVNKVQMGLYYPMSAKRAIPWSQPERGDIIVFVYRGEGEVHDGDDYIKRVVAVAGDRIRLENDRLILNGEPVPTKVIEKTQCALFAGQDYDNRPAVYCPCTIQEESLGSMTYETQHFDVGCAGKTERDAFWPLEHASRMKYFGDKAQNPNWPDVVVPEGHVFVMGDNRDASEDGRFWGMVPYERIKGKAIVLFFPFSRIFTWLG